MREYRTPNIGTVQIIGYRTEGLPMWSINHYIEEFCNNYNKILLIRRICELMQDGANDNQFLIAKKSINLFPKTSIESIFTYNDEDYIILQSKEENAKDFWHIIVNYIRPIVFYKENDNILPLVDINTEDAIKIKSFSYNSPIELNIQGAIDGIIDIANAKNRREMEEERHIACLINESASNVERIVKASQVIDDVRTPQGVKYYANNALMDLMNKQEKLNEKLGIRIERIDIRR